MSRRIIFVTGGAGFIGSNIIARLAEDPSLDLVACDWLHEADLGKWKNLAKHPIGDFVAPENMMEWLEKRLADRKRVNEKPFPRPPSRTPTRSSIRTSACRATCSAGARTASAG